MTHGKGTLLNKMPGTPEQKFGNLRAAYGYDNESRLKSINYSIPGVVDSATETFYYNTSTTDSISDGALTSMALFSNEWIYYRYDSLSRLKERDVGGAPDLPGRNQWLHHNHASGDLLHHGQGKQHEAVRVSVCLQRGGQRHPDYQSPGQLLLEVRL